MRRIAALAGATEFHEFDARGFAPLHIASREGHADTVRALLQLGAKVDVKNNENGVTPLHSAAFRGHNEVQSILCFLMSLPIPSSLTPPSPFQFISNKAIRLCGY